MGGWSVSPLYITDFIIFIERTKIGKDTILALMNILNLYKNIPHEGPALVYQAYDKFTIKINAIPTLTKGNAWLYPERKLIPV